MITLQQAYELEPRLWVRVQKTPGCWLWMRADGEIVPRYGVLRFGSRTDGTRSAIKTHILSWIIANNRLPNAQILHHCDVMQCVRPDHLYDGTHADNMRDTRVRKRHPEARKTHCLRNHEFTEDNTYFHANGTRHCKACGRLRQRIKRGK